MGKILKLLVRILLGVVLTAAIGIVGLIGYIYFYFHSPHICPQCHSANSIIISYGGSHAASSMTTPDPPTPEPKTPEPECYDAGCEVRAELWHCKKCGKNFL